MDAMSTVDTFSLRRFRIGTRLVLGFGSILMILVAMAVTDRVLNEQSKQKLISGLNTAEKKSQLAASMKSALLEGGISMRNIGIQSDVAAMQREHEKAKSMRADYIKSRDLFVDLGLTAPEKSIFANIAALDEQIQAPLREAIGQALAFNEEAASKALATQVDPLNQQAIREINELVNLQQSASHAVLVNSAEDDSQLKLLLLLAASVAVAVGAMFAWVITRSIIFPLGDAVLIAKKVAGGDLTSDVPQIGQDEVSELMRALKEMMRCLHAVNLSVERQTEKLNETVSELELILENASLGICAVVPTDDGRILRFANRAMERMLGYGPGELESKDTRILYGTEEDYETVGKAYGAVLLVGQAFHGEQTYRCKDGRLILVALVGSAIDAQNMAKGTIWLVEDITERRAAELELQNAKSTAEAAMAAADAANQAKSEFLAIMSHEIRTPMNGVLGLSHLALRSQIDPRQRDYLLKIQSSATNLLGILNDILDFSKIEAGKMSVERVEFRLGTVFDNISNVAVMRAVDKGVELLFAVDSETPDQLIGDPLRLGQVLLNLINNAIKFTERGEVVLSVRAVNRRQHSVELQCSVRDTGIGMTPDQLSRLFQSFSQADSSTTRRFGGTGLGLVISQRLVNMMGGTIKVESEPDVGSTFSFTIPFALPAARLPHTPKRTLKDLRVLVVDDNATARTILENLLTGWAVHVELADSGSAAIAAVKASAERGRPFDLVLLDWRMPGLDGLETARIIKQDGGPTVIMVSAHEKMEVMEQADQLGISAFLIKPVDNSLLRDTIETVLGRTEGRMLTADDGRAAATSGTPSFSGACVLLAEDNEINQQVASELLAAVGIEVDIASNGQQAVAMFEANPGRYDAILMDVQMPVMDGLEAAGRIRAMADKNELPIVAITAGAMADERHRCLQAGMNDYVTKPIDPAVLIETLGRWVKPHAGLGRSPIASATEQDTDAQATEDDLPEHMPPFDGAAALYRVNGNKKLLRKLIIDFGAKYGNAASSLRELVDTAQYEAASRLSHTLKGVAGTLEAATIVAAIRPVEAALRANQYDSVPDLLSALEPLLAQASITASMLVNPTPDIAPKNSSATSFDSADALTNALDLRELIIGNHLSSRKRVRELTGMLANSDLASLASSLAAQLERLEFRDAEQTIAILLDRLEKAVPVTTDRGNSTV